jgi:hypothetical protein
VLAFDQNAGRRCGSDERTDALLLDALSNLGAEGLREADIALLKHGVQELCGQMSVAVARIGSAIEAYDCVEVGCPARHVDVA